MREILFRGKRVDNGEWVEGFYVNVPEHYKQEMSGKSYIVSINNGLFMEVVPETVGEYTGLTGKNGKKIFEGDIVECKWFNAMVRIEHRKHLIIFSDGSFCAEWYIGQDNYHNDLHNTFDIKVIGTIYDNPELLEE